MLENVDRYRTFVNHFLHFFSRTPKICGIKMNQGNEGTLRIYKSKNWWIVFYDAFSKKYQQTGLASVVSVIKISSTASLTDSANFPSFFHRQSWHTTKLSWRFRFPTSFFFARQSNWKTGKKSLWDYLFLHLFGFAVTQLMSECQCDLRGNETGSFSDRKFSEIVGENWIENLLGTHLIKQWFPVLRHLLQRYLITRLEAGSLGMGNRNWFWFPRAWRALIAVANAYQIPSDMAWHFALSATYHPVAWQWQAID